MKPFALSALVLAAAIGATTAHAEDFIPDLTGTWNAVDGMVILADGKVNKYPDDYEVNQLVISDQTGSVFKVTQTIKPKKPMTATHGGASLAGQPARCSA